MNTSKLLTVQFYQRQIVKLLTWCTTALCKVTVRVRDVLNKDAAGILEDKLHAITMHQVREIPEAGGGASKTENALKFYINGSITNFRAHTFYTKEPETLEWLDSMEEGSILWDIGANVGLYSVYAAARKKSEVYAFEPSVFNLELLAKNIHINRLTNLVHIVPVALTDKSGFAKFHMSDLSYGEALSSFGVTHGFDGKEINSILEYSLLGMCGDDLVKSGLIPHPQYVKIDVDGIEPLILAGMKEVLHSDCMRSVIVEGNDDFPEQVSKIHNILTSCGYEMIAKRHSEMFDSSEHFSGTFNQIWKKKPRSE